MTVLNSSIPGPNRHERRARQGAQRRAFNRYRRQLRQLEHDANYVIGIEPQITALKRKIRDARP